MACRSELHLASSVSTGIRRQPGFRVHQPDRACGGSELRAVCLLLICLYERCTDKHRRSFTCNTFYLDKAYFNQTYSYFFAVPPALHGQDIAYTYYNGRDPDVLNVQIAIALQEYITSFAQDSNPNEQGVPFFPLYGDDATVQVLNITGVSQMMDDAANERCNWWQKALYQ